MRLTEIRLKNYKPFKEEITFKIKPLTILIGKNNAGKSAIARFPILIDYAININNNHEGLLNLSPSNLDFGNDFTDLIYNQNPVGNIDIQLGYNSNKDDFVNIRYNIQNYPDENKQSIQKFEFHNTDLNIVAQKDVDLNAKYNGKINTEFTSNFDLYFDGLCLSGFSTTDVKIEDKKLGNLLFEITKKFEDSFGKNINYTEPIRTSIKRFYLKKDFDRNTSFSIKTPYLIANDKSLQHKIGNWYEQFLEERIGINHIDTQRGIFEIVGISNYAHINLKDMGYGLGQSLPIITRALMKRDGIDVIEQPELHLHPAAHGEIAELLLNSAKENPNAAFIIETHSENFILRLRRLIAEGKYNPKDIVLYWVDEVEDENYSELKEIEILKNGEVSFWPEGVFSEDFEEVKALRKAQRQL